MSRHGLYKLTTSLSQLATVLMLELGICILVDLEIVSAIYASKST